MLLYNLCYPLMWLATVIHYTYYRLLVKMKRRPSLLLKVKITPETHYIRLCRALRLADLWLLERCSLQLAARYLLRLFETTRYISYKQMDRDYLAGFVQTTLRFQRKNVCVFHWAPVVDKPLKTVLLVHGWEGRGIMFRPLCEALKAQGYAVVMPDLLAHGLSEGKRVSNYELASLLTVLGQHYGPFEAVIGHSSGGLVCSLALAQGLAARRLVLLASPDNFGKMIDRFLAGASVSSALAIPMKALYARRFGVHPDNVGVALYRTLRCPVLICHDKQDARVHPDMAHVIYQAFADSEVFYTEGLGHLGILRSTEVHQRILAFLARDNGTAAALKQPIYQGNSAALC
ncbi:alpha/beta hydrolase [Dickeya lacustris]|uniref:Alpha/beta fold hydrolase n=1 Tax=Dickeya lacustris TaxID=2259638 RepID=A0ABY8G3F3_9GAMM|nr:alpha/beta fold hydrolase [Dickeya lacustris]WFN54472.1 alpha/beta fold hydrolase [Dickeya lacustris]